MHALRRLLVEIAWRDVAGGAGRMLAAALVMGAALLVAQSSDAADSLRNGSTLQVGLLVAGLVAAGCVIYGLSATVLRLPELHVFTARLRRS